MAPWVEVLISKLEDPSWVLRTYKAGQGREHSPDLPTRALVCALLTICTRK